MPTVHNSLDSILENTPPIVSLLDASGVIYTNTEPVPGVQKAIRRLQALGPVFLVTNNSYAYVTEISSFLSDMGISITSSHIISSGQGLSQDPQLNKQIKDKRVYFIGRRSSQSYLEEAHPAQIVDDIENSEVAVIASSHPTDNHPWVTLLTEHKIKNPDYPIICCNPDKIVSLGHENVLPVAGYYAELVEKGSQSKLQWFGKPMTNFSTLVKKRLESIFQTTPVESIWFFDDNPHNVASLQRDLGITGCLVKESGIFNSFNDVDLNEEHSARFAIPTLS